MAASRPEPGALDKNFHGLQAVLHSAREAVSAAVCAANGVLLRLPRKPMPPAEAQEMALPWVSVIVTMVLLKEELICTWPFSIFFRSLRPGTDFLALLCGSHSISFPPLLLFVRDGTLRTLAGTGVGFAALAAHGETLAVAQAAVRTDLGQVLDVQSHLAAKVAFHDELFVDALTDTRFFLVGKVAHAGVRG